MSKRWYCHSCNKGYRQCVCPEEPKPAPPEVPAPDEVFVIVNSDAAPYDVYGDKANADECVIHCGGSVVRYVRAREGGR